MKHVHFEKPGDPQVLSINESPLPALKEGEVLMKITHVGINRAEVLQRQGKIPTVPGHSPILGLEASGYVVDSDLKEQYPAIGLFTGGSYSQFAAINKGHVLPLPKDIALQEGAAIPEAWITAYQILRYISKVRNSETVMIYAGASGVGTAAIQLCKYFGAHAIVSSSSDEKLLACKELGAELCLNYKTCTDQKEQILKFTGGKGVDIVLDCVGQQNYQLTDAILGLDGRWVSYGTMGGNVLENMNLGSLMRRRITLYTTLLKSRSDEYKADLIQQFSQECLKGFEDKTLKPIVDRVINASWEDKNAAGWREAHSVMEGNANIGKIIVNVENK